MAFTVVVLSHLCVTLSDILDKDRAIVSDESLLWQSLEAIQTMFELRKKQLEAVSSNMTLNPNCP